MLIQYGFEDMVVYSLQVAEEIELFEQSFYIETVTTKYVDVWIVAMSEKMESLHKNRICELGKLPQGKKFATCKYISMRKIEMSKS